MPSRRQSRQTGPVYLAILSPLNLRYTRRRFGGRQPLCGIGVTSRIDFTSRPIVCSARIADSRPAPGPLTRTSRVRMPKALAALPAAMAACVAANGVPLRDPLKPMPPALDHAMTAPSGSVMVIVVLLNEAWMCAYPWWMMRFSPRFLNVFFLTGRPAGFLPPPSAPGAVGSAASCLAINQLSVTSCQLPVAGSQLPDLCRLETGDWKLALYSFLLRDGALARALPRPCVGLGALPADRQAAARPHPPPHR